MMKQKPQLGWSTSRVDDTRSYGSVLILYSRGSQTAAREPHAALRTFACGSLSFSKNHVSVFLFLLQNVEIL